jgi:2-polyprenyl-3-methyl-5-hydroxy-6-metoxy-1,4-benzoquinol methylase
MAKDFFQHKANNYEQNTNRVQNVRNIANKTTQEINFDKSMNIIDFGSGTGLLLEQIAPMVKKITAIDMSPSMNKKLLEKKDILDCELEILQIDLATTKLEKKYDRIISSMTLHHIKDIKKLFTDFYTMLNDNGAIALSDLDTEDGTFHQEDTGVHHFGFNRDEILNIAKEIGFKDLKIQTASIIEKPYGTYPVFILTGYK